MPPIQVLIADDHQFFRQELRRVCEAEEGFEVVGEARNGQEAVELTQRLHPDVILMDIEMPMLDGVEAARIITQENSATRIILLAIGSKEDDILQAVQAGATGYLIKDIEEKDLIQAIKIIHYGGALIDPYAASTVLGEYRRISQRSAEDASLKT